MSTGQSTVLSEKKIRKAGRITTFPEGILNSIVASGYNP